MSRLKFAAGRGHCILKPSNCKCNSSTPQQAFTTRAPPLPLSLKFNGLWKWECKIYCFSFRIQKCSFFEYLGLWSSPIKYNIIFHNQNSTWGRNISNSQFQFNINYDFKNGQTSSQICMPVCVCIETIVSIVIMV